ncbi:Uncharacterised protein [Pantoea agglomerans]|uniref:Uncharacterized protein n=1 Tax=Enterobacter agglomerans TaxID=549 RepID=A0A379AGC4_ENTAG|nr:Uncharacterised protein [Pantoea agglomerans]
MLALLFILPAIKQTFFPVHTHPLYGFYPTQAGRREAGIPLTTR